MPGMRGIFTSADLPQPVPRYGPVVSRSSDAGDRRNKIFRRAGGGVVADTKDAAERRLARVAIDFEQLPAVLSVEAALDPASPLVQDPSLRANDPLARTNTLHQWEFGWGRIDEAAADLVIEADYAFPMVTHFAIEPHAFLAAPDSNGVIVWTRHNILTSFNASLRRRLNCRSRGCASSRPILAAGSAAKGGRRWSR